MLFGKVWIQNFFMESKCIVTAHEITKISLADIIDLKKILWDGDIEWSQNSAKTSRFCASLNSKNSPPLEKTFLVSLYHKKVLVEA